MAATVESGQIFGFDRLDVADSLPSPSSRFRIGIRSQIFEVTQWPDYLEWSCPAGASSPPADLGRIKDYFDIDRDLSPVYRALESDPKLRPALIAFRGLRIIRQDSWGALAGFILSSNNHLPRIKKIWRMLCRELGGGDLLFPGPDDIAGSAEADLRKWGLGYRAPYLLQSARRVVENPSRYLDMSGLADDEAKQRLMELPGIGPKVAECALLYGFGRLSAFPVDVWIERALRKLYWNGRRRSLPKAERYGKRRWKENAGYIQQYLFHGARAGVLF